MFAGILDLGRAAIARAQHDRSGAVAEQADGDDVGLGEFVESKRQRAEFDRHQQHVGARPRLREAPFNSANPGALGRFLTRPLSGGETQRVELLRFMPCRGIR